MNSTVLGIGLIIFLAIVPLSLILFGSDGFLIVPFGVIIFFIGAWLMTKFHITWFEGRFHRS